jgi:hypothetical protein
MVRDILKSFQRWVRHQQFASPEIAAQAERCALHVGCLKDNMPDPGRTLIASACRDFWKLERMLGL